MRKAIACYGVVTLLLLAQAAVAEQPADEPHSHAAALEIRTDDPVLEDQIHKVHGALEEIHGQTARRRKALQTETDEARKVALYSELDSLRKEHDALERLLHELVEEAKATEWTAIDEALRRAKRFERAQERGYRQEEVLRDRQQ